MIGLAPRARVSKPRKGWLRAFPARLRGDELRATGGCWEKRAGGDEPKKLDARRRLFANIGDRFVAQNRDGEAAVEIVGIAAPGFFETWRVRFVGEGRVADGEVHLWRIA